MRRSVLHAALALTLGLAWTTTACQAADKAPARAAQGAAPTQAADKAPAPKLNGAPEPVRLAADAVVAQADKALVAKMDGTRWATRVTPDAATAKKGEKEVDSTLIFEKGLFSSSEWVKYGFRETPYEIAKVGDALRLKAEAANREGDVAVFTAEFKGDAVSGEIKTTKKDGSTLAYAFDGKKSK